MHFTSLNLWSIYNMPCPPFVLSMCLLVFIPSESCFSSFSLLLLPSSPLSSSCYSPISADVLHSFLTASPHSRMFSSPHSRMFSSPHSRMFSSPCRAFGSSCSSRGCTVPPISLGKDGVDKQSLQGPRFNRTKRGWWYVTEMRSNQFRTPEMCL